MQKSGKNVVRAFAVAAFAVAVPALTSSVCAEQQEAVQAEDHSHHQQAGAPQAELSEASKAYEEAMKKMHKDMAIPYSNDVDVDFVKGMIPHHQGAIEQAQVLLKYSKNPRLRRLAGGIIAAQRREIRFMQNWLKEREGGSETGDMPDWLANTPVPSAEETTATTPKPKP